MSTHAERDASPYRMTLDELERSVRVPVEQQVEEQPAGPAPDGGTDWDEEHRQIRLAGGA